MADTYTTTTTQGWGSRLGGALKNILLGLLLFLASFGVLYWNEGTIDRSEVAKLSEEIPADTVQESANGKFVSATGEFTTAETIGDEYLKPGPYIALYRNVEVYAWKEESHSTTEQNAGGSETTKTEYTYSKEWVSDAPNSSQFHVPTGHTNREKSIEDKSKRVKNATIGGYTVNVSDIGLPAATDVELTKEKVVLQNGMNLSGGHISLRGSEVSPLTTSDSVAGATVTPTPPVVWETEVSPIATPSPLREETTSPQIGDMRISYTAVYPSDTATVFGKVKGNTITSYYDKDTEETIYEVREGTREAALSAMHSEYVLWLWIFRAVGFLMMWSGLQMFFSVFPVLLSVLPFLGNLGNALIKGVTFVIALVFSIITILISIILHNIIALAIVILVLVIAGGLYMYQKSKHLPPDAIQEAGVPAV